MRLRFGAKGYFLLEALIAISLFSIGVLGIAMTQLQMTKHVTNSKYRVKANQLINSAIVDMQSNPANEKCYLTMDSCGDEWRSMANELAGDNSRNYSVTKDQDNLISITVSWSIASEKTYNSQAVWHHAQGSFMPIVGKIE